MSASVLAPVSEESQAIVAEAFDDADDADSGQQAVLMWPLEELHDLADTDRDLSPLRCSGAEGGDSSEGLSLGGEQTCSAGQNEPGSLALIRQGSQRRSWNRSEDELIRTIVTTNGHRWQQAAGAIPGRSPAAIRNRWTRLQQEAEPEKGVATLTQDDDDRRLWSPALTLRQDSNSSSCSSVSGEDRTKWSADEDATILRCVDDFGKKWRVCAQQLPGRTENAIRNRYHRLLTRANFERGGWHPEEDAMILRSVVAHGNQWIKIASLIPGRSDDAVRNRYKRLQAAGSSDDLHGSGGTACGGAPLSSNPQALRSMSAPLMLPPSSTVIATSGASPPTVRSYSAPDCCSESLLLRPNRSSSGSTSGWAVEPTIGSGAASSTAPLHLLEELRALRPR